MSQNCCHPWPDTRPNLGVETKICEGLCGGLPFIRSVPSFAKGGQKYCSACRTKLRTAPRPAQIRTWHSDTGALQQTSEAEYRRGMARYIQ